MSIIDTTEQQLYLALATAQKNKTYSVEKIRGVMGEVFPRYLEPWRHYHTLGHVMSCLVGLDILKKDLGVAGSRSAAELALWYHDIVYDTKRHDNEELSVSLFKKHAEHLDLDPMIVADVADAIMATRHKALPTTATAKLVVDLDLGILHVPEDGFDLYERQVREEYSWVPDDAWISGRTKVLQEFLDRDWIYATPAFRKLHEGEARANLKRSLARLARGEVLRMVR